MTWTILGPLRWGSLRRNWKLRVVGNGANSKMQPEWGDGTDYSCEVKFCAVHKKFDLLIQWLYLALLLPPSSQPCLEFAMLICSLLSSSLISRNREGWCVTWPEYLLAVAVNTWRKSLERESELWCQCGGLRYALRLQIFNECLDFNRWSWWALYRHPYSTIFSKSVKHGKEQCCVKQLVLLNLRCFYFVRWWLYRRRKLRLGQRIEVWVAKSSELRYWLGWGRNVELQSTSITSAL